MISKAKKQPPSAAVSAIPPSGNICPSCQTANADDVKFCERCGAGLTRLCPECGRENLLSRTFCGGCGTDVEAFLKVQEIAQKMSTYSGEKKWSRVEKEYGLLPENPRLPGVRGRKMLEEVVALTETAISKQKRRDELQDAILVSMQERKYTTAISLVNECLAIDQNNALAQETENNLLQLKAQLASRISDIQTTIKAGYWRRGLWKAAENKCRELMVLFPQDIAGASLLLEVKKKIFKRYLCFIVLFLLIVAGAVFTAVRTYQKIEKKIKSPPEKQEPKFREDPAVAAKNYGLLVPAGFRATLGTRPESYTNSGWAQAIIHEATGIELVYIPAGSFVMGSPKSEQDAMVAAGTKREWVDDETQHQVTFSRGFYLGKTEVTQAQWQKLMGSNPSGFQNAGASAPVENVSWDDCQEFCRKAGSDLRLPTEAEWEYACRAGTTGAFAGNLDEMAWYDNNSGDTTHPVATKGPNSWGLYDMHGNIFEWCQDWYDTYPTGAVTDPKGPDSGMGRVLRGGSWCNYAWICRCASRRWLRPGDRNGSHGLRVCCSAPPVQ